LWLTGALIYLPRPLTIRRTESKEAALHEPGDSTRAGITLVILEHISEGGHRSPHTSIETMAHNA
tara:strand:+ start:600 stop:794 length:195 start_codon:yes stop_codon:yes gene_type:complete